jgi:hypothetical protein
MLLQWPFTKDCRSASFWLLLSTLRVSGAAHCDQQHLGLPSQLRASFSYTERFVTFLLKQGLAMQAPDHNPDADTREAQVSSSTCCCKRSSREIIVRWQHSFQRDALIKAICDLSADGMSGRRCVAAV